MPADDRRCPADQALIEFTAGTLSPAAAADVERHIDRCSACRRTLAEIARLPSRIQGAPPSSPSSPPGTLEEGGPLAVTRSLTAPSGRWLLDMLEPTPWALRGAARDERSVAVAAPPDPPGFAFDELELVRLLGRGGMGEVWLARDTLLERDVAIKIGLDARSREARLRFMVEARAVARLHHPNILAVHRVGEIAERPFLVTELLRGKSLAVVGRLPPTTVVTIGLDLARALTAAHAAGVLHRDIKPANAFLCDDGTAKLLDFGLAKLSHEPGPAPAPSAPDGGPRRSRASSAFATTELEGTSESRVAGTPLFMAPETWRREGATSATDVYSFGALLFALLAGRPPHLAAGGSLDALRAAVLAGRLPDLDAELHGAPAPLVHLVRSCLSLDREARPSVEALCQALEDMVPAADAARTSTADVEPEGNPYRGLLSFEAEHRRLFFGREAETTAVLTELAGAPFVLVIGQSGAGKSSLVRAGVVPRVRAGALGHGPWTVATLVPGDRPLERLAQALSPALDVTPAEALAELASSPAWGAERIEGGGALLLFVDQFEEAWTLAGAADRAAFFEALAALAGVGPRVRLVATLRLDFLGHLDDLGELRGVALQAPIVVGALSRQGLRRVIAEPARLRGVEVDAAVVDALARKAEGAVGMLPLLEFALGVLWERRREGARRIALPDLDALGGLDGALAAHADAALGRLGPRLRAEARRVLLALVTVDRTRARREEAALVGGSSEAREALAALVDARLVVATAGDRTTAYEIAHEVLVSGWPTLSAWLDQESAAREVRARLERGVAEWQRLERAREALWSARQLDELDELGPEALRGEAAAFVAESRLSVRRARAWRWALRTVAPLALLLLIALLVGAVRWSERQGTRSFVAARLADAEIATRQIASLDEEVRAARSAAFGRFDAGDRPGGEAGWEAARALTARQLQVFFAANRSLLQALARDPVDPAARARAADLTYLWLLAAERDHDAILKRDLSARLAGLDDDGSRRARLAAPARLRVTTDPPGAAVVLHAIRVRADGRRVEDGGRPVATSGTLDLAPGSYLLAASAPGRYPTRLPVLLPRGGDLEVEIPLPAAADVPSSFVFVPAGTSLVGSADVEAIRKTDLAEPEHPVVVDAFLIGEREVTFAEYLEYLADLPAAERARRRPSADFIDLSYDAEGTPTLTLREWTARGAAPFCRPTRRARRCQDWRRFPVAGVSPDDAHAYFEWLARRGRVTGARLCTEREWERAARGADGRAYPHGDAVHAGEANLDEAYEVAADQMGIDEVGSHPVDRSPFGVLDLTGNLAEWVGAESDRTTRGGVYYMDAVFARAGRRNVASDIRFHSVGVRVCAPAPARGR